MIFALVGTHEQPFNRFVEMLDTLETSEPIIVQTGYSTYVPKNIKAMRFLEFVEVLDYMNKADVVITHAGTGSVMMAMNQGKCPIVVPRNPKYNEHVDDHQMQMVRKLSEKGLIISFFEGDSLDGKLQEARFRNTDKGSIKLKPDSQLSDEISRLIC